MGALRLERGLSRQQLAEALGLRPRTIVYLEQGEYEPSLAVALKIARLFDLPVEAIFSSPALPRLALVATPPGTVEDDVISSDRDRRVRRLRTAWGRWDAQLAAGLRGVGGHASQRARRWLAVGFLMIVAATPVTVALSPESMIMVCDICMLGGLSLVAVIANATDHVGDIRHPALDEIQIRVRDSYQSRAYRMLTLGCAVAFLVLFCVGVFAPPVGLGIVLAIIFPLSLLAAGLPAVIAGWSLPDLDQPAR